MNMNLKLFLQFDLPSSWNFFHIVFLIVIVYQFAMVNNRIFKTKFQIDSQ